MEFNFGQKETGIAVLAIAVLLFILMFYVTGVIQQSHQSACSCEGNTCPMALAIPLESYIGFTFAVALFILGIIIISGTAKKEKAEKKKNIELEAKINVMKPDERSLYHTIGDAGGLMFQSELVERSGMSKVKVSRILDKMEAKGIIERRRRGMTNVVMLKPS